METLPEEMVIYIAQWLSPRDLAICSGVSHQWRDIFNKDPVWRLHCDRRIEKSLRNIPCNSAPSPPFESMELLSPLCHWRLAFMREQVFLRNWRTYNDLESREIMPDFNHKDCLQIDFLTDTFILVFYLTSVEILDVTDWPAVLVAKSVDLSVANRTWPWRKFKLSELKYGTSGSVHKNSFTAELYVLSEFSLEVYRVDSNNKSICLKYSISLDSVKAHDLLGDCYIVLSEYHFSIFSIKCQKVLNKYPLQIESNKTIVNATYEITTSEFSNLVAVHITFDDCLINRYFIFSLEKFIFLRSIVVREWQKTSVALHEQYLTVYDDGGLSIHDCITNEVVLERSPSREFGKEELFLAVVQSGFVIAENDVQGTVCIKIFCPSTRTSIKLYRLANQEPGLQLPMLNFTLIPYFWRQYFERTWEVFGHRMNSSQIEINNLVNECLMNGAEVNKALTRVITHKIVDSRFIWNIKKLL